METSTLPTQTLAVYPHPHRRLRALIALVVSSLIALGFDILVVWNFGIPLEATPEPNIQTLFGFLCTSLVGLSGWFCFVSWSKWRQDNPLLMVEPQGLYIRYLLRVDEVFLPWEEIKCIAVSSTLGDTYLSIRLRDAHRWWSTYGNGKGRTFRCDPLTHAQLNLGQTGLSLLVRSLFHLIEQNYAQELAASNVQLRSD